MRLGALEHPQKVLEQHHLARHHHSVAGSRRRPVHQLLKHRVVHDVGVHQVAPPRAPDVDGLEILIVITGSGGGGKDDVVAGGGDAAVGAGELGEGGPPLDGGLELGELAQFGHEGKDGYS